MKEKQHSALQIIDCLSKKYHIDVVALTFLPWGADTHASVYKAQTKEQSYFVKLKCGHNHELSARLTSWLYAAGMSQIIPPLNTVEGRPTQAIDEFTLMVYPFIDGKDGFNHNLTDAQWITLGKALKQLHQMVIPLSIQNQIRRETYSPQWRIAVHALYAQMEGYVAGDETALKLLKFMIENKAVILQLVERAEYLSLKLQTASPALVLCHSDIHAGNVLVDNNEALYIVDWDEPIMAPIERDLMFIGGGVANVWNQPHEVALFYQGYGKVAINNDLLAYYRYERIVEDIAIYGHDILLTVNGGENRKVMYQHFIEMFAPQGVIEIAFKTDQEYN